MSLELSTAIDNAEFMLANAIPAFAAGTLGELDHAHAIGTTYRSRGISELLLGGVVQPLHLAQMQSTSAYAFGLRRSTNDDEKVTSLAGCFWDAVSAQYWDAAREIATLSRMSHNPSREHEDDYLYVAFLMQRYFLDAPADEQQQLLDRWTVVLEGNLDPRHDLCRALRGGDQGAFEAAIVTMSDNREAELLRRHKQQKLTAEQMAWLLPVWPEGLALLRLAERDGMSLGGLVVPRVPPMMCADNVFAYHPDAWRSLDFQPTKRP
ncbi:MAG TPA: hypothetical protein VG755_40425 [Nannocystaceae bacterium]|nr:hypothetical protein [Nannocystaceae bacterium]